MSNINAYPLHWPIGWPRAKHPESSRFDTSFAKARDALFSELRMMEAKNIILSTNIPLRQDGIPYAIRRQPDNRGVAVYFKYKGKNMTFACDRWMNVEDNVQAVRKTIEALRGIDRWGASDMIERAFTGFVALSDQSSETWWVVLGVNEDSPQRTVDDAYKKMRVKYHPDKFNGDHDKFIKIQESYKQYLAE